MYKEHERVIFCGNGYGAEWPIEAEKRGLPNLKNAVEAAAHFSTEKSKAVFSRMGIFSEEEVDARAECLYENYAACIETEANTLLEMIRTGVEPACAEDLAIYAAAGGPQYNKRSELYASVTTKTDSLEAMMAQMPEECVAMATFCCDNIKPLMLEIREVVDASEKLVKKGLWPYPSYTDILFTHHMSAGT